jgi:hypothetical protein
MGMLTTDRPQLPAGASGPFSQQVTFLCGGEQANPAEPVCAQTRSFTTSTPAGDVATGHLKLFEGALAIIVDFLATSGPSGENPSGHARHNVVTCLSVSGNRATVGSMDSTGEGLLIWATEDPPGSGSGVITFGTDGVPTPVDCSTPVGGAGLRVLSGPTDQLAVYDTP